MSTFQFAVNCLVCGKRAGDGSADVFNLCVVIHTNCLPKLKTSLDEAEASKFENSRLEIAYDRVVTFFKLRGLTSREEILRYNYRHMTDAELTTILLVLTRGGAVKEIKDEHRIRYEWLDFDLKEGV